MMPYFLLRRRGGLKIVVLSLLYHKPMSGIDIMNSIETLSMGFWRPSPGSIYPVLKVLMKENMIKMSKSNGKKIYELTEKGRKVLKEEGFIPLFRFGGVHTFEQVVDELESYIYYIEDYINVKGMLKEECKDRLRKCAYKILEILGERK